MHVTLSVLIGSQAMNAASALPRFFRDLTRLERLLPEANCALAGARIVIEPGKDNSVEIAEKASAELPLLQVVSNATRLGNTANRRSNEHWALERAKALGLDLTQTVYVNIDADGEMLVSDALRIIEDELPGFSAAIGCVNYTDEMVTRVERAMFDYLGPLQALAAGADKEFSLQSPGYWVVYLHLLELMAPLVDQYESFYRNFWGEDIKPWGYPGLEYQLLKAAADLHGVQDFRVRTVILGARGRAPDFSEELATRRRIQAQSANNHLITVQMFRKELGLDG
jgi:hypothetical protein